MKSLGLLLLAATACASDDTSGLPDSAASGEPLPSAVAFGIDLYPSQADCDAAKNAGTIPPMATCQQQMLFCPDGTVFEYVGDVIETGTYLANAGALAIEYPTYRVAGTLRTDGTLVTMVEGQTFQFVWQPIAVTDVKEASCN